MKFSNKTYLLQKKFILILILAITSGVTVHAQGITAKARMDSTKILLGDQIKLFLEVTHPKDVKVTFPALNKMLSQNLELIQKGKVEQSGAGNNLVNEAIELTVTSFDSGKHEIPPFYFKYSKGGITDSVKTNTLTLSVNSFKIDQKKGPTDIKSPYSASLTLKEILPYLLGIILLLSLIFFLLYAIPRRKKALPFLFKQEKPLDPPHIVALRELDHIKEEKPWEKEKIKEFYTETTDIIRNYIVRRFGVSALEQTSEETIKEFRKQRNLADEKSIEQLEQMLSLADLVKFAKYTPLPDDHTITLANAYFFILHTQIEEMKKPEIPVDDREGEEVEIR
ncbi:MAG: hypothetical protein Q8862_03630 [Bacteroidota bacterium]|nr:hypothetical protein [Bacteroidota bacterium]